MGETKYNEIPSNSESNVRIMTWNVRYFTNVDNEPIIDKISKVIEEINPDIISLLFDRIYGVVIVEI